MAHDGPEGPTMTPAELALWTELAKWGRLHASMSERGRMWTAWFEQKARGM